MIWKAIASVFSSNAKPVNDVLDKDNGLIAQAGGWIGNLSYTDQEKAENTAKLIDQVIEHVKATANENTQRSLTRRQLSIAIIRVELFLVLACVTVYPFNEPYAKFLWDVASSTLMFGAFGAVVIFFFGSYGIGQHLMKGKAK